MNELFPEKRHFCFDPRYPIRKTRKVPNDDCYIFDIADGGKLAIARVGSNNKRSCSFISDIMDPNELDEVLAYFKTIPSKPMMVTTKWGRALALPWLFPSCSFVMLSFPIVGADEFYRVSRAKRWDIPRSSSVPAFRARVKDFDIEYHSVQLWREINEAFGGLENDPTVIGKVHDPLTTRTYAIADYAACFIGIVCYKNIDTLLEIDVALFTAFMLMLLMSAFNRSNDGRAAVDFRWDGKTINMAIRFIVAGMPDAVLDDSAVFASVCMRKNIHIEYLNNGEVVHIYFNPIRRDWAILRLKEPSSLDGSEN